MLVQKRQMWRSRRRTPVSLLPPCADGSRAHRFAVKDAAPLPDGRVVGVVRTCQRKDCDYKDVVQKWYQFESAQFTTKSDPTPVYEFMTPGKLVASWKPRPV